MSAGLLKQQLQALIRNIDSQIWVIQEDKHPDVSIYKLQYPDGTHIMPPLLLAKAQVLNALAVLEASK
jgi:hypothetical protein